LRVDVDVATGVANHVWAIVGVVRNGSAGGEQAGGYFQGHKLAGAGATWGVLGEVYDYNVDPLTGVIGAEFNITGNGTDASNNRVGVDLAIRKRVGGGATLVVGRGFSLQNNGTDKFKTGFGCFPGTRVEVGADFSTMVCEIAALKVTTSQAIVMSADNTKALVHTGGALSLQVSGVEKTALLDTGGLSVQGNQVVGARGGAIANATDAASAITQLNAWLTVARNHGLITT
jgi:hypothetical protein